MRVQGLGSCSRTCSELAIQNVRDVLSGPTDRLKPTLTVDGSRGTALKLRNWTGADPGLASRTENLKAGSVRQPERSNQTRA